VINIHREALTIVQEHVTRYDLEEGIDRAVARGDNGRVLSMAMARHIIWAGLAGKRVLVGARGGYGQAVAMGTCLALTDRMPDGEADWFFVRDTPKAHGLRGRVSEGSPIAGQNVIIVDTLARPDELLQTCHDVTAIGDATLRAILPVTDLPGVREQIAGAFPGTPYLPLFARDALGQPA
jgi:hypothetical protein